MAEEIPPPSQPPSEPSPLVPTPGLKVQSVAPDPAAKLKKDKKPLPLLSRVRTTLKPPRNLPAAGEQVPQEEEAPKKRGPRRTPLWLKALSRLLAYAAIVGLAYLAYQQWRETQIQGALYAPGYELPKEIFIVRDFTEDLKILRQEFVLARQPFQDELKSKQESLQRVQADLSGLEERQRLIQQEIQNVKAEVETLVTNGQLSASEVWIKGGQEIEAEYELKLNEFEQRIVERAKQLGLDYKNTSSLRSPEVWVNAFRLSLYNPPKAVKSGEERIWAEDQLKLWREYEKENLAKRQKIKTEADEVKKAIGPRVTEINERVKRLQARLVEAGTETQPIIAERDLITGQVAEARASLEQQTKKYFDQLYQIPTRNILDKLTLSSRSTWEMRQLDANSKYPPGSSHLLWVQLKKDGQEFWALVPVTTELYHRTDVMISAKAFVRAQAMLE